MKILWATPFNEFSAVGRFSSEVCAALASAGHEIEIMRTEIGESLLLPPRSTAFNIVPPEALNDASSWDMVVANLGNHAPFHGGCFQILTRCVPFLILHDAEMRDFAWGAKQLLSIDVHGLVPASGAPLERAIVDAAARLHLGFYASMSCGAVVHGPHYRECVETCCPGPVGMLQLSFPDIGALPPRPAANKPFRIVIFGHINPNKQVDRVMRAASLLAGQFETELHLVGMIHDQVRDHCRSLAAELGVAAPVFFGQVQDEELCRQLAAAHVVCCLRHPVSEGGSASLATALYAARPVIVADAASYSMVPDEFVWKVSYGEDPGDVADRLAAILSDLPLADKRAAAGTAWALEAFSAKQYADALLPLLTAALALSPWLRTVREIAVALPDASNDENSTTAEMVATIVSQLSAGRV